MFSLGSTYRIHTSSYRKPCEIYLLYPVEECCNKISKCCPTTMFLFHNKAFDRLHCNLPKAITGTTE